MGSSLKVFGFTAQEESRFSSDSNLRQRNRPATVLNRRKWNDIDRIGTLQSDSVITEAQLGEIEGPTPCLLADFNRQHELSIGGSLDLIQPAASAKAEFKRAKEAVASFGAPVLYTRDLLVMEAAIESAAPGLWNRPTGQALADSKTFVVFQVVKAKLSFLFRGSGSAGINLAGGPLKDLKAAGLNLGWTWRNQATLESKKEILIAANLARYNKSKGRLIAN